tara:strand:- start:4565 stop:4792 length:228 start_codon:yes stop_codon:yes gene_type:complete
MSWWTTCTLLLISSILWLIGRDNSDDVIGLLQKILSVSVAAVVLLFGHNLLLELLALLTALRLPPAQRSDTKHLS